MATKHAPATQLPWDLGYIVIPMREAILKTEKRTADAIAANFVLNNFEYIARAANAYPKLVEALRAEVEIDQRSARSPAEAEAVRLNTLSVLRELGELE